jgi:hypothetical protein
MSKTGLWKQAEAISSRGSEPNHLVKFYKSSLENDLKFFHTPTSDRVKAIFVKYLSIDVTEGWTWNHYDPARVRKRARGPSSRPLCGQSPPLVHGK